MTEAELSRIMKEEDWYWYSHQGEKRNAFISFPMSGYTIKEVRQLFKQYKKLVRDQYGDNYRFTNRIIWERRHSFNPARCLGKSIEHLAEADVVFFARGWENARGCVVEHLVAEQYGKRIKDL